jgi:hypothetical protein
MRMAYVGSRLLLMLCLLALAAPAAAQQTTGEIVGRVTDTSGGVLPGVTVVLRSDGVAGTQTAVTTGEGQYRFPLLPPGSYQVEYTLAGFSTLRRDAIPVSVGGTVDLNVQLAIGGAEEVITVTGEVPVVNALRTSVSTNYDSEWVRNAPVRRNSYFDYVNSAPGISAASNIGQSSGAQSLGSSTNENQYQIDGTNISSTPWVNGDAVEQVEVVQLGASAQYGNVQGAVFNIVTRQGSNLLHGDVNFYYQNKSLTGRNTTDEFDSGRPYYRDTYRDFTAQASGAFVPNKFWFFGSFQHLTDFDAQPGADPRFPALNEARKVFWKFNYNINAKHRLMHGYHDDYYWIPGTPTLFTAPETINLSHGHNPTPNFVYTGTLSDTLVVEARYSGFFLQSSNDPNQPGAPRVGIRYEDDDTGLITGAISQWTENRSWRNGTAVKFTRYTERFLGGSHDTSFGVQLNRHGGKQLTGPNDTITTASGRLIDGETRLPYYQGSTANTWGVYIDDTFRFKRATFNMGVRYDDSNGAFQALPFVDAFGNPTGAMSQATDSVYRWRTISPRVGVSYTLNQSGATIVKAHAGRYYTELSAGDFRAAVPSITPSYSFRFDEAGNRVNFVETSSNENLLIDPDLKPAYTDQYMAQVEQQLSRNFGLQVAYAHKRGENYSGWTDIAGVYEEVPYVDSVGRDATGETFMVYKLVSPAAERQYLLTTPGGLYSRYNGMTVQLTRRFSNNWSAVASVVYSKSTGRLPSSARATASSGQSSSAGTFGREANGPNDYVNTEGLLVGDRPVVAKLNFVYQLPWGIMAATNLQYQSGKPYARHVRVSGLGFPSAPTIAMEERDGSRRVDPLKLVDVRLQKDFVLPGSPMKLGLFVDMMNLTNDASYQGIASNLGTSSAFGVPTSFIPPRRFQIGTKLQW